MPDKTLVLEIVEGKLRMVEWNRVKDDQACRSQIYVHTDERTQVHSSQSPVLPGGHPSQY